MFWRKYIDEKSLLILVFKYTSSTPYENLVWSIASIAATFILTGLAILITPISSKNINFVAFISLYLMGNGLLLFIVVGIIHRKTRKMREEKEKILECLNAYLENLRD